MKLHIMCERDVGMFSLIQQVIANIPWAMDAGRVPIAFFQDKTCYWTPRGYKDRDTVWEYYFEPIVATHPASTIPPHVRDTITANFPTAFDVGYFADDDTFVSAHYGDHPALKGKAFPIPYLLEDPDEDVRRVANDIMRRFIRPRDYIQEEVHDFFRRHLDGNPTIGVHVRGTDSLSDEEQRAHRRSSLDLSKYVYELRRLINAQPSARVFVATDALSSLNHLRDVFGTRVVAYDSLRHESGEAAGKGPTGWLVPAYIAGDRDRAARNGEEAIIEYLLLSRCDHLVHNGSSIARTVLLNVPQLQHTNTLHMTRPQPEPTGRPWPASSAH